MEINEINLLVKNAVNYNWHETESHCVMWKFHFFIMIRLAKPKYILYKLNLT